MKNWIIFLILFLTACSKKEPTPIGHSFKTEINHAKITLVFHNDGKFSGQFINDYFGQYKIEQNEIKFTLQGSTMKIGPLPLLEQENTYFNNLKKIHSFSLNEDSLFLMGENIHYQFHLSDSNEMNIH